MALQRAVTHIPCRLLSVAVRRLSSSPRAQRDQYWQDRCQLAGAYRLLDQLGLNEGICNHLTLMSRLPAAAGGAEGTPVMLVIPYGLLWSEVRASSLLAVDAEDRVVDGDGEIDITALTIHREVHKARPDATAVFHTHMPYTTALACLEDPRIVACHQNSPRFVHDMAYDPHFGGYADEMDEGKRIAQALGDKPFMIMQAHGSLVTGPSTAFAFDRMYFLERACMFQVLAASTGAPLYTVKDEVVEKTRRAIKEYEKYSADMHFQARLARLRRTEPEFET